MNGITFQVRGVPGPQGSKTPWGAESSPKVKPWREAVKWSAIDAAGEPHTPLTGPVEVVITFCLPRPKFHYYSGKKRNGELRDDAPHYVDKRPDIDKLARSTLDALTSAGMYSDDATVAHLDLWKTYADPTPMGCTITIRPLNWLPGEWRGDAT